MNVEAIAINLPKKKTIAVSKAAKEFALCFINNNLTSIKQFLKKQKNFNINQTLDKDGKTALHLAVQSGSTEIVNFLFAQRNINVNTKDNQGNMSLFYAVKNKQDKIVNLFMARDDIGLQNCIEVALKLANEEMISQIFYSIEEKEKFFNTYPEYKNEIIKFLFKDYCNNLKAGQNSIDRLKMILKYKKNEVIFINDSIDEHGNTLLHQAIENCDLDLVKLVLEQKIDITIKNKDKKTALESINKDELIFNCSKNKTTSDIIDYIIIYSFKEKIKPSRFFSYFNEETLGIYLRNIKREIKIEEKIKDFSIFIKENIDYFTEILFLAIDIEDKEFIENLFEYGLSPNVKYNQLLSTFTFACYKKSFAINQLLLKKDVNLFEENFNNLNILDELIITLCTELTLKQKKDTNAALMRIFLAKILAIVKTYLQERKIFFKKESINHKTINTLIRGLKEHLNDDLPKILLYAVAEIIEILNLLNIQIINNKNKPSCLKGVSASIIETYHNEINPNNYVFKNSTNLFSNYQNVKKVILQEHPTYFLGKKYTAIIKEGNLEKIEKFLNILKQKNIDINTLKIEDQYNAIEYLLDNNIKNDVKIIEFLSENGVKGSQVTPLGRHSLFKFSQQNNHSPTDTPSNSK